MASAYKSALRVDADSDESMSDASLSSSEIAQEESTGEDGIEDENNVVEKLVKSVKSAKSTKTVKSTTGSTQSPELRNRILMLTSRGVTFRHRHLLTDLCGLLPHTYKASKLETKKNNNYNAALNGLADLHSCNYVFFFEGRKRGQDLYAWIAAAPNGPTIKAHVTNVHTMSELGFGGNVLKGGRGVVVFDKSFDEGQAPGGEYKELVRELLRGVFCVPQKIRGVKPFIDRVISVHNLDGKIWLRVYEIREGEKSESVSQDRTPGSDISLVEVGPRMVLNVITILEGSFGGPVLYSNRQFVSPNVIRREARESKATTYAQRRATTDERKIKRKTLGMENAPKSGSQSCKQSASTWCGETHQSKKNNPKFDHNDFFNKEIDIILQYLKMALQDLAPELIYHIYNSLPTISDVINLSLTCHRYNSLLRNAQKLGTLFAAADREFGPVEDIKMLVTYNSAVPVHVKRDPPMSYSLLRQMIVIGTVGKKFEELYPSIRWQHDFINRRALTSGEARRVRQAVYRHWLYSEAFHNRMHPRTHRLIPGAIEERCQLLRSWSTKALIDIEDVRTIMEDILTYQICPTDGTVQKRVGKDALFGGWLQAMNPQPSPLSRVEYIQKLFHDAHDDYDTVATDVSAGEARLTKMDGWGDEISQYYYVQSLLKLNPAQMMWLHDHATYKWQVEGFIRELGEDWFWNNGQTFSDTWTRVLHARSEDIEEIRAKIFDCELGVAVNQHLQEDVCEIDL